MITAKCHENALFEEKEPIFRKREREMFHFLTKKVAVAPHTFEPQREERREGERKTPFSSFS